MMINKITTLCVMLIIFVLLLVSLYFVIFLRHQKIILLPSPCPIDIALSPIQARGLSS